MKKKLKQNSFAEGAFIAYFAIVITKLMGALYNIPFYRIIGDSGGFIYSCAYNIYALFLDISTSGVPIAMSIIIGEYNAMGKYRSKEKAYRLGLYFVFIISLASFLFLQFSADGIADYFLKGTSEGVKAADIATAIKIVSLCLLVVPFLSVQRGYLQGHKFMAPSSVSQVIEQVIRIGVVLVGAYFAVDVLKLGTSHGVYVSLFGAGFAALVALLYIMFKRYKYQNFFIKEGEEEKADSSRYILKKMISYCTTIIIISITVGVYNIVDMKLLIVGLHNLGFSDFDVQTIASITSNWVPKICMIIAALAMGMTSSIAPHMAESYAKGNFKEVNKKLNQAIAIVLLISTPLTIGMIIYASVVYNIFYGVSAYGSQILVLALILNMVAGIVSVISMTMQSMNKGKSVCYYNVVGVIVNTAMDLPLIYLFAKIGIAPYLGATVASILGQLITLWLLLNNLNKDIALNYHSLFKTAKKLILPLILVIITALLFKYIWVIDGNRRVIQILQLMLIGGISAVIYFIAVYKTGALEVLFDNRIIVKIIEKLNLSRRVNGKN